MILKEAKYYTCKCNCIHFYRANGNIPGVNESTETEIEKLKEKMIKDHSSYIGKKVISSKDYNVSGTIISLETRCKGYYNCVIDLQAVVRTMRNDGKPKTVKWVLSASIDSERYEKAIRDYLVYLEKLKDPLKAYYDKP